ncbi:hypothetical protein [Kitasatospora sp. NPDC088783]|uniref:hypothetical protein n=1 Tax=Kitasatospora sp. NPDC088783 TaxID=3364077 RepID=UPI0038060A03
MIPAAYDDLTPAAEPVDGSPWAGVSATGPDSASGTVRAVYRVDGMDVALLSDERSGAFHAVAVDLLSTDRAPAAFPGYEELQREFSQVEEMVFDSEGTQGVDRYRELSALLTPFNRARAHLHTALIERAEEGDAVAYPLHNFSGTVVDPDSRPNGVRRTAMLIRLDARHLADDPDLRKQHPGGLIEVSTGLLWPLPALS